MTDTKFKLPEINREYSTFRNNQVLTAEQLNRFIRYLDGQQRLSRVLLNGVGIVCGLNLRYDPEEEHVILSPGCGVTTDGDLLYTEETAIYPYFRKFTDDNARYALFRSEEEQIELWELRTGEEDSNKELREFATESASDSGLSDMVALLYLESFSREPDLCTALDCDNLGLQKLARQRVLMVHKEDVDTIIQRDDTLARAFNTPLPERYKLPRLRLKRPLLDEDNTERPVQLHDAYREAVRDMQEQLNGALRTLYRKYHHLLDPEGETDVEQWIISWYSSGNESYEPYFQYRYDAIKDVVHTYEELRTLLLDITVQCMPSFGAFPRHLMLGRLTAPEEPASAKYRHLYYPSPAHEQKEHALGRAKTLFRRIDALLSSYRVPEPDDDPENIRITPAPGKANAPLSGHPIPYYYKPLEVFRYWSYEQNRYSKKAAIHSYHAREILDHAAPDHLGGLEKDEIARPLNYDLDGFDFFRIEGHQGRYWHEVMEHLISLKKQKNLPFDVIALKMGDIEEDIEDYGCRFEDLEAILKAWETELQCKLANVTRFFSGINLKERTFTQTAEKKTNVYDARTAKDRYYSEKAKERYYSEKEDKETFKRSSTGTVTYESRSTAGSQMEQIRAQQQYYETDYTVIGNLELTEHSLGSYIDTAYKETPERCAGDVEKEVRERAQEYSFDNDDERKLMLDYPLEVITLGNKVIQQKPASVFDFKDDRLETFEESLQQLCSRIDMIISHAYRFVTQPLWDDPAIVQRYLDQLRALKSICCSEEKIREIRDQLEERKKEILKRTILSEYIQHQSGLEHLAGVPRGGTFVIVYKDRESTFPNVLPGTVIADFSLPYVCCSDCPPVSYILPPRRVSLRLRKGFVCLEKDSEPEKLPFEVYPRDAIIKAKPDKANKAIVRKDDKYWFDPGKIDLEEDRELLGKTITFTVNDQDTETEFVVYRKPEPGFSADPTPIDTDEPSIRKYRIDIENNTDEKDGEEFEYVWFVDGEKYYDEKDPEPLRIDLAWGESRVVTIRLEVTNGKCEAFEEKKVKIESEERIALSTKKDHLCVDPDSEVKVIDFVDLSPADGKIEAVPNKANKAVIQKDGTNEFDLNQLDSDTIESLISETITFTVNGKETGAFISVYRQPKAEFEYDWSPFFEDKQYFRVKFRIKEPESEGDEFTYRWEIDGSVYDEPEPEHVVESQGKHVITFPAKLKLTNKKCHATYEDTVEIRLPVIESEKCLERSVEQIKMLRQRLLKTDVNVLDNVQLNTSRINAIDELLAAIIDKPDQQLGGEEYKSAALQLIDIYSLLKRAIRIVRRFDDSIQRIFVQLYELVTAITLVTIQCQSFDLTDEELTDESLQKISEWFTGLNKDISAVHKISPIEGDSPLISIINEIIRAAGSSRPKLINLLKEIRDQLDIS